MGKTGKALKRRRLAEAASLATSIALDPSPGDSPPSSSSSATATAGASGDFLQGLISAPQLALTVQTLQTLNRHPDLLKDSSGKHEMKALRGAVFDFQRVAAEASGTGNSLISRISSALSTCRYTDALVLLSELRIRGEEPKLGALQRWVRECDAASRADGSYGDAQVLKVLDSILRCCNGVEAREGEAVVDVTQQEGPVRRHEEWVYRPASGVDIYKEIKEGTVPAPEQRGALAAQFRLLLTTPGPERLPPNHHPALQYTTIPASIPLSSAPSTACTRISVPHVPGAFLLTDILSLEECRHILSSAESVGFSPDRPIGPQMSVLAHNLYWLADTAFMQTLNSRFLHLLPPEIDGGKVVGVNARFRVYRYVPGSIYRPHLDGAAPPSGLSESGDFQFDTSPAEKPQMSRLTFLIYLNDHFTNGCTTFFLPSPERLGQLDAYPVKPLAGSALVFPHGDSKGSLLHEGSPVRGEGEAKYVIRTEVIYELGKNGKLRAGETGREGG